MTKQALINSLDRLLTLGDIERQIIENTKIQNIIDGKGPNLNLKLLTIKRDVMKSQGQAAVLVIKEILDRIVEDKERIDGSHDILGVSELFDSEPELEEAW